MRQISSQPREGSASGWRRDATDAAPPHAPYPAMQAPRSPQPPTAPKDFTAQVMARLSTPLSPPDPRQQRALQMRAKAGLIARVYVTLILVTTVAIALLALLAPWTLITLLAAVISAILLIIAGIAFVARATGGFVSGFGVVYAAMLAALTPPLLMLAHRFRRQRSHLRK